MTRLLYISVLILCIFTSFVLYFLSYDSKNIKREISQVKTAIENEKSDIETLTYLFPDAPSVNIVK